MPKKEFNFEKELENIRKKQQELRDNGYSSIMLMSPTDGEILQTWVSANSSISKSTTMVAVILMTMADQSSYSLGKILRAVGKLARHAYPHYKDAAHNLDEKK